MTKEIEYEIVALKERRQAIDIELTLVKHLPASREKALAITKLQEAIMWLGMDLKRIGETHPEACPNPYPNSKDPSNTVIDETADNLKL